MWPHLINSLTLIGIKFKLIDLYYNGVLFNLIKLCPL